MRDKMKYMQIIPLGKLTLFFHAGFKAFTQPTVSTLIPFVFVNHANPIESVEEKLLGEARFRNEVRVYEIV